MRTITGNGTCKGWPRHCKPPPSRRKRPAMFGLELRNAFGRDPVLIGQVLALCLKRLRPLPEVDI